MTKFIYKRQTIQTRNFYSIFYIPWREKKWIESDGIYVEKS